MVSEVIVILTIFSALFGVCYLYFSTRNKERMALIEKGADASIFARAPQRTAPVWKILTLNFALLLMGIGAGVMIGGLLHHLLRVDYEIAMPGSIFLCAGTGLLVAFFIVKKMSQES